MILCIGCTSQRSEYECHTIKFKESPETILLDHWIDHEISLINLQKNGFVIEYLKFPISEPNLPKQEICISNPKYLNFENDKVEYVTTTFISDELSAELADFEFNEMPRIIFEISDKLSQKAKLLISYSKDKSGNKYGHRYSLNISEIIEFYNKKSAQQADAPEPLTRPGDL